MKDIDIDKIGIEKLDGTKMKDWLERCNVVESQYITFCNVTHITSLSSSLRRLRYTLYINSNIIYMQLSSRMYYYKSAMHNNRHRHGLFTSYYIRTYREIYDRCWIENKKLLQNNWKYRS